MEKEGLEKLYMEILHKLFEQYENIVEKIFNYNKILGFIVLILSLSFGVTLSAVILGILSIFCLLLLVYYYGLFAFVLIYLFALFIQEVRKPYNGG